MRMWFTRSGEAKTTSFVKRDAGCIVRCHRKCKLIGTASFGPRRHNVDQLLSYAAPAFGGDNKHRDKERHVIRCGELVCQSSYSTNPHSIELSNESCAITSARCPERSLTPDGFGVGLFCSEGRAECSRGLFQRSKSELAQFAPFIGTYSADHVGHISPLGSHRFCSPSHSCRRTDQVRD
jgi:hypothetical protein